MSRSTRKPYTVDGYGSKWKQHAKKYHNRMVRRKLKNPEYEIADGGSHKRGHGLDPWDICDYRWFNHKPISDKHLWRSVQTMEEQLVWYHKICRK